MSNLFVPESSARPILRSLVLSGVLLLLAGLPLVVRGADIPFTPEVKIPGIFDKTTTADSDLIGRYIQAIFVYFIWIVGVLATAMITYGGIKWVAAAGDPGRIQDARDLINSSIIGIIIGLTSVVLLNLISPQFTIFHLPSLKPVTGIKLELYDAALDCYQKVTCPTDYARTEGGRCGSGGAWSFVNPDESPCTSSGVKGICCSLSGNSYCQGVSSVDGKILYSGTCYDLGSQPAPVKQCATLNCGVVAQDRSCTGVKCPADQACYLHDNVGECVPSEAYYTYSNQRACSGVRVWMTAALQCGQSGIALDDQGRSVTAFGSSTCPTGTYCFLDEPTQVNGQCTYVDSATRCKQLAQ